ncbi:YwqJ-related putative deaminase [Kitasatospora sp. McL0602]|uniref:YwqJ-related putative deaminase n=1 Tax=Kitasatospora sp. McL0602 TaxID=3439530 RepID=UPI003F8C588E
MPEAPDPVETVSWLESHGWSHSRDIGERARQMIAEQVGRSAAEEEQTEGSSAAGTALLFLAQFGGLTLPTASGSHLRLVPAAPANAESEAELAHLQTQLGRPLFPVGAEVEGPGRLLVTAEGWFFRLDADGARFLGENPVAALGWVREGGELPSVTELLAPVTDSDAGDLDTPGGEVPHTASSLMVDQTIYTQTNALGVGEPDLHPAVREFLAALPPYQREPFALWCAEASLVSDELHRLDERRADGRVTTLEDARAHFAGSQITSIAIRLDDEAEHGKPVAPCRSCEALLTAVGVEVIGE